jgi:hypothetical protein
VNPVGTLPNVTLEIVFEALTISQFTVVPVAFVTTTSATGELKVKTSVDDLKIVIVPIEFVVVVVLEVVVVVAALFVVVVVVSTEELEEQPVTSSNDNPNKQKTLTRTITTFFAIISSSFGPL